MTGADIPAFADGLQSLCGSRFHYSTISHYGKVRLDSFPPIRRWFENGVSGVRKDPRTFHSPSAII